MKYFIINLKLKNNKREFYKLIYKKVISFSTVFPKSIDGKKFLQIKN